jgi:hypothetical protein
MKTPLAYIVILTGLLSCDSERIFQSDVEVLIDDKKKSTENILEQLEDFIEKHGKEGFEFENEIVGQFFKTHRDVSSFLDSLDNMDRSHRVEATYEFIDKTFDYFEIKHPYETSINENTPLNLIKLQIVDLENAYLREWETNVSHRFNNISAVIIPDKIDFAQTEKITGTVGFMAYSDDLKLVVRMNGKDIKVENGKGYFSVDPAELKEGQRHLKAEIIFSDTSYTTILPIYGYKQ